MLHSSRKLSAKAVGARAFRLLRQAPGSARRGAGFSLIEMLVVVACLGMIFWISAQLLFPMRTASERQRLQVEARQTARSAADYMTYILRGATDGLPPPRTPGSAPLNPLALVIWVLDKDTGHGADNGGCPGTDCVQLSYNNVAAADQFGDPGTDIITVGQFDEPVTSRAALWPGYGSGADAYWFFEMGCGAYTPPALPGGDDEDNFDRFKEVTGYGSVVGPGGHQWSKPLIVYDDASNWSFYQIVEYNEAQNTTTCTDPNATRCILSGDRRPCLWVNAAPGVSAISSPGGHRTINEPAYLSTAVRFLSFRVCNGWLQQRNGLFDPTTDNNCLPGGNGVHANWTPLVPNVEDMQIAYVFRNGQVMNSPQQQLATQTTVGGCDTSAGVPCQGFHAAGGPDFDASRVLGLRVTIVGRSPGELVGAVPAGRPLSAEDHILPDTTTRDRIRRHLVSANALIRNRAPST